MVCPSGCFDIVDKLISPLVMLLVELALLLHELHLCAQAEQPYSLFSAILGRSDCHDHWPYASSSGQQSSLIQRAVETGVFDADIPPATSQLHGSTATHRLSIPHEVLVC